MKAKIIKIQNKNNQNEKWKMKTKSSIYDIHYYDVKHKRKGQGCAGEYPPTQLLKAFKHDGQANQELDSW